MKSWISALTWQFKNSHNLTTGPKMMSNAFDLLMINLKKHTWRMLWDHINFNASWDALYLFMDRHINWHNNIVMNA